MFLTGPGRGATEVRIYHYVRIYEVYMDKFKPYKRAKLLIEKAKCLVCCYLFELS